MHFLSIEEKILNRITSDKLTETERVKLRFGFYLVLDTIKKGVLIYLPAIALGILFEVFIVHCSFFILRQVCFGWHGRTNLECLAFSIIFFMVWPLLFTLWNPVFSNNTLYIAFILLYGLILLVGPIGTKINPLDKDQKLTLRKKLMTRIFIVFLVYMFVSVSIKPLILLGACIQLTTMVIQFCIDLKSN